MSMNPSYRYSTSEAERAWRYCAMSYKMLRERSAVEQGTCARCTWWRKCFSLFGFFKEKTIPTRHQRLFRLELSENKHFLVWNFYIEWCSVGYQSSQPIEFSRLHGTWWKRLFSFQNFWNFRKLNLSLQRRLPKLFFCFDFHSTMDLRRKTCTFTNKKFSKNFRFVQL